MKRLFVMTGILTVATLNISVGSAIVSASEVPTKETFTPYRAGEVPQNVTDLWKDYDARKEPLDVKVIKEWKEDGVVSKYITFKVGTFKGADARIAAYYCFPDNGLKNPAFVWCHGGGQRADRSNGEYFAKQGFATVDINWLGKPLENDIDENTDWGKVDPTQGPRFYSKALRKGWKRDLQPDEYSIDPVPSPRNNNWFLLVVAAKRALTFLEEQPEVNADRLGIAGFSMGGMVTALAAIDTRLKAVAPFVGGSGFKYLDFPGGLAGTSIRAHFKDLELYKKTIDASSYWPLVTCPVVFISSSNDFHAAQDRVYRSMALLPHKDWRVSTNVHENHGPGPEQWILLNMWFNLHLKGIDQKIPVTPPSTFAVNGPSATFTVTPDNRHQNLVDTEIYYSYDPNARTRFWSRAAAKTSGKDWIVDLPVHNDLPLYVFALCRYSLEREAIARRDVTSTFVVNSLQHSFVPEKVDLEALANLEKSQAVFEDFKNGIQDWSTRAQRDIRTYKFQSPRIDVSNDKQLNFTIDPMGRKLSLRLNAESRFLGGGRDLGSFSFAKNINGNGPQDVIIDRNDFQSGNGKKLEWSRITRFDVSIVDLTTKDKLDLTSKEGHQVLKSIRMVDPRNLVSP